MGLLDKFRKNKVADKVGDVLEKSGDKIAGGVDKATDFIDDKTKGKFQDKLEKVDKLADKLDRSGAEGEGEGDGEAEGDSEAEAAGGS